jgi:hypothetical protein
MNPQGFLKVLDEMEEENKTSLQNNLKRLQLLESDVGSGISDQYQESSNKVMGNANPPNNPAPQNEWSNIWKPIS